MCNFKLLVKHVVHEIVLFVVVKTNAKIRVHFILPFNMKYNVCLANEIV